MTAASIMDTAPAVLKSTDTIREAANCIMEHRYRSVPVLDPDGRYLGVFGVNCLLRLVLPKAAIMEHGLADVSFIRDSLTDLHERLREVEDLPVTHCLNVGVEAVPPDEPLEETLLRLYRTKSSIPVVAPDSGKLLGMISYWDVGRHIQSAPEAH